MLSIYERQLTQAVAYPDDVRREYQFRSEHGDHIIFYYELSNADRELV